MNDSYHWFKALHLISLICWMAGMLYLPRIYVYHCRVAPGSEADGLFQIMERKLLRFIMLPAMIATWIFGFALAIKLNAFDPVNGVWLHYKLLLVLIMSGIHGMLSKYRKDFAAGRNTKSERFYRVLNEIPAVLLIGIVILVVVKPV